MSFVPLLSKVLPESISKMARGRYYRNRFVAISEVSMMSSPGGIMCLLQHIQIITEMDSGA